MTALERLIAEADIAAMELRRSAQFARLSKAALAEQSELTDVLRAALERLSRLGAEDDDGDIGPCPVCERIRSVLAKHDGK